MPPYWAIYIQPYKSFTLFLNLSRASYFFQERGTSFITVPKTELLVWVKTKFFFLPNLYFFLVSISFVLGITRTQLYPRFSRPGLHATAAVHIYILIYYIIYIPGIHLCILFCVCETKLSRVRDAAWRQKDDKKTNRKMFLRAQHK